MPIPIRTVGPMSDWKDKDSHEMFLVDVDALAGALGGQGRSAAIQVNAEATDEDATILLDLFNRGTIVSEAESVEDKKYAVPQDFAGDKLLRLKAASLVSGDSKIVRFTSKAVRVIKTLVLAEQNAYAGRSVQKPYSVIMAENRALAASRSTLAFQKTASLSVAAQSNIPIPAEYMPRRDTPYVESERIVKREGTSNKQYIVRIFNVNGKWAVIAWNGKNGGPDVHLTLQPKGHFDTRAEAQGVFSDLLRSKRSDRYDTAGEVENINLLGSSPRSQPAAPRPTRTAPAPAAPRRAPAKAAPKPAPKPAPAKPVPARPVDSEPVEQYIAGLEHTLSQDDEFDF